MGEGLRIHLFGEPHFEYGSTAHTFSAPPKTLPLLAYLLLHRHEPVARETLGAALWPESDRAESLANVRRHLHYLAKALPAGAIPWITTTSRSVSWNASAPYWLDVEAFETESQDRRYRAHAAHLYSGDLYERCADDWIFYDRERLRSMQMSNLALLIADARERNAFLQALQYAQLMLALDPWREDALRSVIEIRGFLGDHSGALAEYERFAQRLNEELGVAPSDETAELYARLRQSGSARAHRAPRTAPETHPLTGRRNELAVLAEEWHRARQGRAHVLLVGGEAGIGKTALLDSLAALAWSEDAIVLRGNACTDAPYQAFADAVRDVSGAALYAEAEAAQNGDRLGFFDRIAGIFARIAQRPVLIILEDLHLAGSATLDLLRYIVTRLHDMPLLLAASYREFEIERGHPLRALRRQMSRSGQLSHLAVTPLDRQSAHELLRTRARRPMTEEIMDRIYEAADGNPLFMIETLHQFAQGENESIPGSVAVIVRTRLASLQPQSRTVAETAAVAGRQCSVELIAQVTGLREGDALRAFDELVERHIMRDGLGAQAAEFTFVHDLVRQSVYEQIPETQRRRRHARIGLATHELHERDLDEHAGVLARHFELGGLIARAAAMYECAARNALRVYALDEAQYYAAKTRDLASDELLRARALLMLDSVAESRGAPAERVGIQRELEHLRPRLPADVQTELLFRRAEVLVATNGSGVEAALGDLRSAVKGNDALVPRFLLLSGDRLHQQGENARASGELRLAHALFKQSGDMQGMLASYSAWISASIASGVLRPQMVDEIEKPDDLSDPRTAALLAYARGRVLFNYDPAAAYAAGEEMLGAARLAEDRWLEALAYRILGSSAAHLNQFSLAQSHLQYAADLMLASGRPYHIAYVRYHQMQLFNRAGHIEPAYESAREAYDAARRSGSIDVEVRTETNLADTDVAAGDLESAIARLRPALERAERYGLGGVRPAIMYLLGALQVALEDPATGIATLIESRRLSDSFGINYWHYPAVLGLAHLVVGDRASASAVADDLRDHKSDLAAQFFLPQAYLWCAAHLYHFLGREDEAREFAAAAHERYTAMLATIADARMREAFLNYRFNRAIVHLVRDGIWAPDPLHSWFRSRDVGNLRANDSPAGGLALGDEHAKTRAHR